MKTRHGIAAAYSLLATFALALGGCGSPEEKVARYVRDAQELYERGDLVNANLELRNALQIQPRNARARYVMALLNEREEAYRDVVGNLQMAVESDPDFVEARVKLGNYYAVGGMIAETRAQADAALALQPQSASVRMLSARALYLEGKKAEAQREVGEALRLDPARRDAITLSATLHAEAGEFDRAVQVIDQAAKSAGKGNDEDLRRVKVALLTQAGDVQAAERELTGLAKDFPASTTYDLALARLYGSQGRVGEAEQRIRSLIARDPDNAEWRVQLAGLLASQNKPGDAEASLRESVAQNPKSMTLRLALGGFYESDGRADDARAAYRQVAAAEPTSADGLAARNRLVALSIGSDDREARELIAGILADAPNNVDALIFRAAFHVQDNKLDESIADLRSALARQPNSSRALLLLARAYVLDQQATLAEDTYRRLLKADPGSLAGRNELATLVGYRGNIEEAEALLRDSLKLNPGDRQASATLVNSLLSRQDFKAAEAEARRILEQGDNSGQADFQLAVALRARNESEQALAAYRQSLTKRPLADEPLKGLVSLLVETGRTAEAETFLTAHLERHPGHMTARLLLGELYRASERPAQARAIFSAIATEQPTNVNAYVGLAALEPPDSESRLAVLAEAHARNPGSAEIGLALGAAREKRGDYEGAIKVYETVMEAGGSSEFIADNLAVLLLDNRSDAASHARALKLMTPFAKTASHPFSLGVLGWAYYRNGQYPNAQRYLERAIAGTAAENPQLRYYLGMTYLKAGNTAGARQALELAVQTATGKKLTFKGLADARAELARLSSQAS